MMKAKQRKSSIELLRIIAILLIVLSHSNPYYADRSLISYINLDSPTTNINVLVVIIFRALGQVGNVIFIICSAWFLIDSKKVKINKVLAIFLDLTIISIIFLVVFVGINGKINEYYFNLSAFPMIYKNAYWFIVCYLLFYIVHPYLTKIVDNSNKNELLALCIILFVLYSIFNMIFNEAFYYTEFIGFIEIYFLVAYMKKYLDDFCNNTRKNVILFAVSHFLLIIYIMIRDILLIKANADSGMLDNIKIYNPFIILVAISLFNIFRNINIKGKMINYIAKLSIWVFLFTENIFIRELIRPQFFLKYYGNNIIILCMIEFVRLVIFGYFCSAFYDITISKITKKISEKASEKITKSLEKS